STPFYHQYIDNTNGISLDWVVGQALQANKELIAARQKRGILQGRRLQASLRPNPKVEVEFLTDQLSNRKGEYDFSTTYLQPIERGGKREKRIRVVDLELAQIEKEIIFQEQKLRLDILTQYANALASSEHLKLLEKLVKLNEENFQIVQVKFKEGDVAKLDLQLTEVELNRWKIQQLQAELQVKASFTQIKFLAGLQLETPLKLKTPFPFPMLNSLNISQLQTLALENRADLQAARIGEEIAQARIDLAQSQAKTNIDLFAKYQEERKVEENGLGRLAMTERKIGGGISFSLPLYNRNQGDIVETTASKTQASYLREQLEQKIKQEIAIALAQFLSAEQTLKLFETNILPKAQDNLKILQVAYQLGDQDLLDVITEERRFIESQREYLAAHKEYYLSLIALEKAVGTTIN
ncbi:MAG: cobalt-zinc-cadmium resistance protein CzcC, partial [bacterium]